MTQNSYSTLSGRSRPRTGARRFAAFLNALVPVLTAQQYGPVFPDANRVLELDGRDSYLQLPPDILKGLAKATVGGAEMNGKFFARRTGQLRVPECVVECAADVRTMNADVTKVRRTLFNLLSNATKFTEKGNITLTVARPSSPATHHSSLVTFRVTDTGIGMTPQQMGRLFHAFEQADASTTKRFGGTGLGLAISKKFCQMMGGDITVEREPGRGTTFTVTLPAGPDADAVAKSGMSPTAAGKGRTVPETIIT